MFDSVTDATVADYTDLAGAGDTAAAIHLVDSILDEGFGVPELVRDLLAPSQTLVGLRWERGEWSVAREHTATAVTNEVLTHLPSNQEKSATRREKVIVAMAEGDWHNTSARMIAAGLSHAGFSVTATPAGTSAGQVAAMIHDHGPRALVLTCSQPSLIPGARRLVVAAQDAGTPAVVGGRAFGTTAERANRLGANGWAADLIDGARKVAECVGFSEPSSRFEFGSSIEYSRLRQRLGEVTEAVRRSLEGEGRISERDMESALFLLRSLMASMLIEDTTILRDDAAWLANRTHCDGPVLGPVINAISAALPQGTPNSLQALESVADQVGSSIGGK